MNLNPYIPPQDKVGFDGHNTKGSKAGLLAVVYCLAATFFFLVSCGILFLSLDYSEIKKIGFVSALSGSFNDPIAIFIILLTILFLSLGGLYGFAACKLLLEAIKWRSVK